MSKKHFLFPLLVSSMLSIVSSCDNAANSTSPITIEYGRLYDETLESENAHFDLIDHAELTSLISNESDFVLLVYKKNDTCGCWINSFRPNILSYMKKNNLLMYAISYTEFGEGASRFGLNISSSDQTIGIFENGALKYSKTRNGDDDPWAVEYEKFSSWMDERIKPGKSLYVSNAQLNALYAGNEKFTIGWMRKSCGDCSYIARHSFKDWAKKDHEGVLYLYDCDDPISRPVDEDGNLNTEVWQNFKDKYGLSNKYNTDFGFDNGYVPTFHHIDPGIDREIPGHSILDGMVVFNDTISKGEDGGYYVSSTYFSDDRLDKLAFLENVGDDVKTNFENMVLNSSDVTVYPEYGNYISWNHESAENYYAPLLNAFLDCYVG